MAVNYPVPPAPNVVHSKFPGPRFPAGHSRSKVPFAAKTPEKSQSNVKVWETFPNGFVPKKRGQGDK